MVKYRWSNEKKRWNVERLTTVRELLGAGKSLNEIAKTLGVSIESLQQACHRAGISAMTQQGQSSLKNMKQDLSQRLMWLQGLSVIKEVLQALFSDDQLRNWIGSSDACQRFCKDVLNVELQPYQLTMIDMLLKNRRCCFILGRQSGKDFVIACYIIWLCIVNPNRKVLLISPSQRQSDLLFNRIMTFIASNNQLFDSVQRSNMELITLKNNSQIYSLPATSFIRGYTEISDIFLNEAHGITEETMQAVTPMLAIKQGNLTLMSTPMGTSGVLWNSFNDPLFAKLQLPSSCNKYISKEWLAEMKATMPAIAYDTEINAQFSESIDSFFKLDTIVGVTKQYSLRSSCPDQSKKYFAGIDWGRVQDSSVVTILSKDSDDQLLVEAIVEMQNIPFREQEERIKALDKEWHFRTIMSEYAGLSINSCENLKRDGLNIEFFTPTLDNKVEAYRHLLKQFEDRTITIPNHANLQFELRSFKFEMNAQGKMKLHHVSGGSDDFVDSLCFSVWATKVREIPFAFW